MKKKKPSATALGTAATRAIETEKNSNERICNDPLARQLTSRGFYWFIKRFGQFGERRTHGALTFIVCRCRFIDDYLQECLASGVEQIVILGAGLDSRAYRHTFIPPNIKIFEIDHPATQANKIERIKMVIDTIPQNLVYVSVDFNLETLDKLLNTEYFPSLKTLFIWEGVTPYLTHQGVDGTLAWIKNHAEPGSRVIFDYLIRTNRSLNAHQSKLAKILAFFSRESRTFGIDQEQINTFLTERGFTQIANITADQLTRLYCVGPNQDREVSKDYAIVHAAVPTP